MFSHRIELFRLFGFPVRVDISWLFLALLITWSLAAGVFPEVQPDLSTSTYWIMGVVGALGLFLSIVVHEFAHSMVAQRYGMPMKGITLFIFGGVAEMEDEPPSAKAEFFTAIAGPITSIVVGALFLGAAIACSALGVPGWGTGVLQYLGTINLILVAFNVIPAFPLDGGRVLRSLLWHRKKSLRRATRTASRVGTGFGLFLVLMGGLLFIGGSFIAGLWWILIGLFLRTAAQSAYQQILIRRALEGESVQRFMSTEPVTASSELSVADFVDDYVYRYHHKFFPVTQNGTLVGAVTTRQIGDVPRDHWGDTPLQDVVRPPSDENTIEADQDAMKALSQMRRTGQSRLMVVEGGELRGIITMKDLLNFLSLKMELEEDESLPLAAQAS